MRSRLNNGIKLMAIYVLACTGYIFWNRFFTIPVHLGVDEQLYISMAKSFHYTGHFAENGQILNYSCYFYSILISLAYFFYSPEKIVFLFRCIGVVCMLSSIFPVYLLAKQIFGQSRMIWGITLVSAIIPSMSDIAYCMQETLAYPIALWIMLCIYRETKREDEVHLSYDSILIMILGAIGYFVKTYLIFIPVSYLIYVLLQMALQRNKHAVRKLLFPAVTFLICYLVGKVGLIVINGGISGVNHYSQQFSGLFPINFHTILSIVSCIIFYTLALLFYWGVFPCILPLVNYKSYKRHDQRYILFLLIAILMLIMEIVILIVVTEERKAYIPHKFLYRYFQILEIPVFCMFMKMNGNSARWGKSRFLFIASSVSMAFYFGIMGLQMRTAIIDAPVFLLFENATKHVFAGAGCMACVTIMIAGILGYLYYRNYIQGFIACYKKVLLIGIILFMLINSIQLPYYSDTVANGNAISEDACDIAAYLNQKQISRVYYVTGTADRYEQAVYAYLKSDMVVVSPEEADAIAGQGTYFIKAKTNQDAAFMKTIVPDTKAIDLCTR